MSVKNQKMGCTQDKRCQARKTSKGDTGQLEEDPLLSSINNVMDLKQTLSQMASDIREIKAILAQLRPHDFTPSFEQELKAIESQGVDLFTHFKEKGKAEIKASRAGRRKQ